MIMLFNNYDSNGVDVYFSYPVTRCSKYDGPEVSHGLYNASTPEAEFKEKHGVRDSMPELTITLPYVHSRVDSDTFTIGNAMPKSTLTLCQSQLYPPVTFDMASDLVCRRTTMLARN
jgi:hypothetical protein